ncbi:aminotransferase class V-fold PLP-dependent enzyme [Bradyrhizobium betae]
MDPEALEAMLDDRVRLIALTWLPANGGLINPAAAIGKVARCHGIPYFIDAAQAVGQLPVDVAQVGCDVLSGAGRKRCADQGAPACSTCGRISLPRLTPAFVDTYSAPLDAHGEPVLAAWRGPLRIGGSIDGAALRPGQCLAGSVGDRP